MRELTAYEELCLDRIEAETHKEQLRAASDECRRVLAGKQTHVLLLRSDPSRTGLYDAGQLWELIVDRYDDAEMSIIAGARFGKDDAIQYRADRLVTDVLDDLAEEHAVESAKVAVRVEINELTGVEA